MKNLFLIRHAKSSWDDPSLTDALRPLLPKGKKRARTIAELLHRNNAIIEWVLSSPARRASDTAEIFMDVLQLNPEILFICNELYFASPTEIIQLIQTLDDSLATIACFGHQPDTGALAGILCSLPPLEVPTSGVLLIKLHIERWKDLKPSTGDLIKKWFAKELGLD